MRAVTQVRGMRVRLLVAVGVVLLVAGTVFAAGALIWLPGWQAYEPEGALGKQLAMARLGVTIGGVVALLGTASCAGAAATCRLAHRAPLREPQGASQA